MPRAASCPVHRRRGLSPADRTPDRVDLAGQRQRLARRDDALEAAVVDAREERDLAAVLLLDEHGDRTRLGHRLDDQHARHHGPLGEVPGEPPVVVAHEPRRDDLAAGLQLDHLVEEQERVAVRQDRLDLLLAERRRGDHVAAPASRASRIAARPRCA